MKKQLLLFVVAIMISATGFSQIMLSWEFGPTSLSPSISFNGAPSDFEIVSHVNVTNTGSTDLTLKVARQEMLVVENTINQFCWAGICFPPATDTSATEMTLTPGETTQEFSGHLQPNSTEGVSIIKYTFFEVGNETNKAEVIVHYNSKFSVSSISGIEISEHLRMISGPVNEELNGMVEIHNNGSEPLTLIAIRGAQIVDPESENYMAFGGTTYPAAADTTAPVTIMGGTTDNSFEAYYNPNNMVTDSGTIAYAFIDVMDPTSYAVFTFIFDGEATGLSEAILSNTTFSAAYPNPASDFVSFDYDIPGEVNQAELVITNLLGAVVYEGSLNNFAGTERINVSQFTEGIYFASLKLDNEIALSQKILVQ